MSVDSYQIVWKIWQVEHFHDSKNNCYVLTLLQKIKANPQSNCKLGNTCSSINMFFFIIKQIKLFIVHTFYVIICWHCDQVWFFYVGYELGINFVFSYYTTQNKVTYIVFKWIKVMQTCLVFAGRMWRDWFCYCCDCHYKRKKNIRKERNMRRKVESTGNTCSL